MSQAQRDVDQLLFKAYAVSAAFFSLKVITSAYQVDSSVLSLAQAWPLYLFSVFACAIFAYGAQRWLLSCLSLSAARCVVSTHLPSEGLLWFPAAEWALYLGLPLLSWGALTWGEPLAEPLTENDASRSAPSLVQWVWRLTFICSMSFAALHKLNADFLNPEVSCVQLSKLLTTWWGAPALAYDWISPLMIIIAEAGLSVLLLWRPRLGVLIATLIFAHFGSIGATAFAMMMLVMALSFLSPVDLSWLKATAQRLAWRLGALSGLVALGSWLCHIGPYSWPQYGLFHAAISAVICLSSLLIYHQGLGDSALTVTSGSSRSALRSRRWLQLTCLLWVCNGLSPYLGLKFQYSFAMLSNLRVDDSRWNSLVFPQALRFTQHDDHFFVAKVEYRSKLSGRLLRGGLLKPGLYSAAKLRAYLESAKQVDEELRLDLRYQGERFNGFERPIEELWPWLNGRPTNPLIQDVLPFVGAQRCVH